MAKRADQRRTLKTAARAARRLTRRIDPEQFEQVLLAAASAAGSRKRMSATQWAGKIGRMMRASYDAAQTTGENRRHWANADALAADAAHVPEVRRLLRTRTRYEVANNSLAKGICLTLANDVVGTGPRLQVLTEDPVFNRLVEKEFTDYSRFIRLASKLRTMRMSRIQDGEAFGCLVTNPRLRSRVKLDLKLVEADQVADPTWSRDPNRIDGIQLDAEGNVVGYLILHQHPGDLYRQFRLDDFTRWDPSLVLHWFRQDRPGQHRGVPELTPALPTFALLRRFILAVISTAEIQAEHTGVVESDAPADTGVAEAFQDGDEIVVERGTFVMLPGGHRIHGLDPTQPPSTFREFVGVMVNDVARCLNMPYNIAACNSSTYNYASGMLDHQTYYRSIAIDRADAEEVVLDPLLDAWTYEAARLPGYLGRGGALAALPHLWIWDGPEHVDPVKYSTAKDIDLANGTLSPSRALARQGLDAESEFIQAAKDFGITIEEYRALLRDKVFGAGKVRPAVPPDAEEIAAALAHVTGGSS